MGDTEILLLLLALIGKERVPRLSMFLEKTAGEKLTPPKLGESNILGGNRGALALPL